MKIGYVKAIALLSCVVATVVLARLAVGQNAMFSVDSFPGREFAAKVTRQLSLQLCWSD